MKAVPKSLLSASTKELLYLREQFQCRRNINQATNNKVLSPHHVDSGVIGVELLISCSLLVKLNALYLQQLHLYRATQGYTLIITNIGFVLLFKECIRFKL